MSNRTMVPMESLIKSISMGPFGSDVKVEYMRDNGMPIIDGSNLTSIKMNWDSYRYLDIARAIKLQGAIAHKGDIIVTHRGTIGQLSYVPEDSPFEEFLISQSQFRVTLDTEKVNPVYFAYYFHTSEGQKRLLSFANYVGVPALASATTNFRALEIPLIPLEEQNQIANILKTIEEKIANNNEVTTILEQQCRLLYDFWFVQFDFPDENGKPYKSSGGKMVWNEELKREIPEEWGVNRLGNLISYSRGVSYTGKDMCDVGTPIISLASIDRSGRYIPDAIKYYNQEYPPSKVLKPYDLVMANTDMTQERAVMGRIIFVPDIFDGDILSTHHVTKVEIEDDLKDYLMMTTQTDWFHKYIKGFSSGTNVLGMDMVGFEDYMLLHPSHDILIKFNSIIHSIYKKIFEVYKENSALASLRDFLLPMLMNGQVKVGKEVV